MSDQKFISDQQQFVARREIEQYQQETFRRLGKLEEGVTAIHAQITTDRIKEAQEHGAFTEWRAGMDAKLRDLKDSIGKQIRENQTENDRRFAGLEETVKKLIWYIIMSAGLATIIGRIIELFGG